MITLKNKIEYNGESHTLKEWSKLLKIPYPTLYSRISRGYGVKDLFTRGKLPLGRPIKKKSTV